MNWVTEFWMSESHEITMTISGGLMIVATIISGLGMSDETPGSKSRKRSAQRTLGYVAATPVMTLFSYVVVPILAAVGILFLGGQLVYEACRSVETTPKHNEIEYEEEGDPWML